MIKGCICYFSQMRKLPAQKNYAQVWSLVYSTENLIFERSNWKDRYFRRDKLAETNKKTMSFHFNQNRPVLKTSFYYFP